MDKATNTLKIADLGLGRAFSVPVKSYTHEARSTADSTRNNAQQRSRPHTRPSLPANSCALGLWWPQEQRRIAFPAFAETFLSFDCRFGFFLRRLSPSGTALRRCCSEAPTTPPRWTCGLWGASSVRPQTRRKTPQLSPWKPPSGPRGCRASWGCPPSSDSFPSVPPAAAELARKTPLFPGDSELQQLLHIFK